MPRAPHALSDMPGLPTLNWEALWQIRDGFLAETEPDTSGNHYERLMQARKYFLAIVNVIVGDWAAKHPGVDAGQQVRLALKVLLRFRLKSIGYTEDGILAVEDNDLGPEMLSELNLMPVSHIKEELGGDNIWVPGEEPKG